MLEENPQAIPTHELVAGRTTRRVNDASDALERLKAGNLLSDEGFMQSVSVSLPKLVKQVQQYGELSPMEARQEVATILHDLIIESTGKAKLCRRELSEME